MVEQDIKKEAVIDIHFRLLAVAALISKIRNGITMEELYRDAERKFDSIIEILNGTYTNNINLSKFGYSVDDLKEVSLLILNRLISDKKSSPYMTLCVSEDAPLKEIKRRRNRLLHIFHPDRNWGELSDGIKTRRINEAYDDIVNKRKNKYLPFKVNKAIIQAYSPYRHNLYESKIVLFLIIVVLLLAFYIFMKRIDLL